MNHIHHTIFNRCLGLVQVVGENAKRRGKGGRNGGSSVATSALVGFATNGAVVGGVARKRSVLAISLALSLVAGGGALAAPQGGDVKVGQIDISLGKDTVITQQTQKGVINWQGFSIASGESVTFHQPNAAAVTLNRVIGNEQSVIDGVLKANGQIFLVNPQGVLFNQNAAVDVGGLVASTRDISGDDFSQGADTGSFVFQGEGAGAVEIKAGAEIVAAEKGYVVLLGQSVHNQGHIVARKGEVVLAAGKEITLSLPMGAGAFNVSLTEGDYNVLAANNGVIEADGGRVLLTAHAASTLAEIIVNNTGVLRARTLADLMGEGDEVSVSAEHKGGIELVAVKGAVSAGGTIAAFGLAEDASGQAVEVPVSGGAVVLHGEDVRLTDDASIDTTGKHGGETGELRLESGVSLVVGDGGVAAGAISAALEKNNVALVAESGEASLAGDITLGGAVTWNANTRLTLDAAKDIYINNAITAEGEEAGVSLEYGEGADYHILTKASFSGVEVVPHTEGVPGAGLSKAKADTSGGVYGSVTFTHAANKNGLVIGERQYELVHSLEEIASTGTVTDKYYALAKDIDAAEWSAANTGKAAVIGTLQNSTITGLGHTVNNLLLNASKSSGSGLIGFGSNVLIRDLGMKNTQVTGKSNAGSLAGSISKGNILNVYTEKGTITATGLGAAGGLIGAISGNKTITQISHAYAAVEAVDVMTSSASNLTFAGGLIGAVASTSALVLQQAHATGNVSIVNTGVGAGGLVGGIEKQTNKTVPLSSISAAYATGTVSGMKNTGGLVGVLYGGEAGNATLKDSFATGTVIVAVPEGVDANYTNSNFGGLVGFAQNAEISNVYATGGVQDSAAPRTDSYEIWNVGGLVGGMRATASLTYAHASGGGIYGPKNFMTAGGLAGGVEAGSIAFAYSTIDVIGMNTVGGIVGSNSGKISDVWAQGRIEAQVKDPSNNRVPAMVGGIVGNNAISGRSIGEIERVSFSGDVVADGDIAGGIVGNNSGTVKDAIATGSVQGKDGVGGIVGDNNNRGAVSNSIADNTVTGEGEHVGGIAGVNLSRDDVPGYGFLTGEVSNSYFNQDKNPGLEQVSSAPYLEGGAEVGAGKVTGGGGLTTGQLADNNIQDAILNGGDVAGAVAGYETAHAPVVPPVEKTPVSDIPSNLVDFDAAQTIAAQVTDNKQQMLANMLPDAIRQQTGNFERVQIPLEQLMAHLSNASSTSAKKAPPEEASDPKSADYNSSVNDIAAEKKRYSTGAQE